jgi:hypothetical protein
MPRTIQPSRKWALQFKYLSVAIALLLLGFVWSLASPQGSAADEDYHTVNIYCAMGESELCQFDQVTGQVLVPEYLVRSNCYMDFPAYQGAGCLKGISEEYVITNRYSADQNFYSPLYFRAMSLLAGSNYEQSVLMIRIAGVLTAAVLLFWAMITSTPAVRRGLALSWGVVIVPVGIFYIASVNPSSWLIASIGTFWAFLATLLSGTARGKSHIIMLWLGLVVSMTLAIGSRTDSVIYLAMITVSLLLWHGKSIFKKFNVRALIASFALLAIGLFVGLRLFLNRYQTFNFSFPGAQTGTDQPNAILKTLVELPAFFLGLLGGQGPQVGLSTGITNEVQAGYTHSGFYYGIGWLDFSLPPLVSVIAGLGLAGLLFIAMRQYNVWKFLSLVFIGIAVVVLILLMRATIAFAWGNFIQPRYVFPIFLAFSGLALTVRVKRISLINRLQAGVLVVGITTAASIAWLATATRYAVGPNAAYTNFGQTPEWWWNIGPGRLGWFLITVVVSGFWALSTIWVWGRISKEGSQSKVLGEVNA